MWPSEIYEVKKKPGTFPRARQVPLCFFEALRLNGAENEVLKQALVSQTEFWILRHADGISVDGIGPAKDPQHPPPPARPNS